MSASLAARPWLPLAVAERVESTLRALAQREPSGVARWLDDLIEENQRIHDETCLNLNPATNRMNPRAEQMLGARLGSRASLGYPGEKYETGLEAIEQIEIIAAELAAQVFHADYAEVRVGSGALANLYAFMACCAPGDSIIAPPASIAGHVTHHGAGAAGLYRLTTIDAPVSPADYTVDVDALNELARTVRPKLITIGGSLNLAPHPVAAVREIADAVGAKVLFDAAHLCGVIAGGAWPNPLDEGAHLMSLSTYKSLGGPPGGLLLAKDAELAQRIEAIAYPGLTANFDAGKTAALAQTMLDWTVAGKAYAATMVDTAGALAELLAKNGVPVYRRTLTATRSHQFAVEAADYGGGQTAAARLRRANLLASGIGLPITPVVGDLNGLRLGTPEAVRLGMTVTDMPTLAAFITRALNDSPEAVAGDVTAWRKQFRDIHFTTDNPT
ncbi:MAG TPA: aminotransferase class I/II-fold pyridoxal phosphate-dependent enzyme [Jatrophihabitans sp.]|nr:aminotransferase class I/II-fold pyridoxal phosphate-dependent enzyme [Jatrophihabitans sp.]